MENPLERCNSGRNWRKQKTEKGETHKAVVKYFAELIMNNKQNLSQAE